MTAADLANLNGYVAMVVGLMMERGDVRRRRDIADAVLREFGAPPIEGVLERAREVCAVMALGD